MRPAQMRHAAQRSNRAVLSQRGKVSWMIDETLSPSAARAIAVALMREHGFASGGSDSTAQSGRWAYAVTRNSGSSFPCTSCWQTTRRTFATASCTKLRSAIASARAGHGPNVAKICRRIERIPERCGEARMPDGGWTATCPAAAASTRAIDSQKRHLIYSCSECGWDTGKLVFRARRQAGVCRHSERFCPFAAQILLPKAIGFRWN